MAKAKKNKLTVGEIAAYSLGSLGREFSNNCINSFFLVYLCIYQGLNPMILTVAFVLAKLWDAVNDPMLATIVNNSKKSRFGRYRPWILVGAVINAVTIVAMFSDVGDISTTGKYAYYLIAYVLWGMSFTVLDVPFWTMLPTMANSTDERNQASSMAKLVGGFGGFLCGMLGTSFILPMFADKGMMTAYRYLGMAAGLIMIVFLFVTVIGVRERYELPHENVGLRYILSTFRTNDQLRAYAGSLLFYLIGTTIALSQMLYLYTYCYEDGADFLPKAYSYTLFWVIACTGQGIAMIFYSLIVKKLPREKLYGFSFLACIVSYVLLFVIFFFLTPGRYILNTVLVALSGAFLMIAAGINQIGSTVMIADIVDYGEWKTGKRGDSVMFSVQTLITKFAGAVAALILGIGIAVSGLPTITDMTVTYVNAQSGETSVATKQFFTDEEGRLLVKDEQDYAALLAMDEEIADENIIKVDADESLIDTDGLTILRAFMFLSPIPLTIIGYFIYKRKYYLYGEKYDSIKKEIDLRRESGK